MKKSPTDAARESAEHAFASGLFCAESVVFAIAETQGMDSELLLRASSAFCGGMARSGGTCGALTGAVMGVSLALGRSSADDSIEPAYSATKRLIDEFEREFGSRDCPELLSGCNLDTMEGQEIFREQDLARRCMHYTGKAAEIAARVIADGKDSTSCQGGEDDKPGNSCGCACC